jgi:hypothetical protein
MNKEQEKQNEINEALMQRALIGRRSGWGAAIKWFKVWEEGHNKKWEK